MTRARRRISFATILQIAAETPAQLQRCDVYRVVDAANEAGCLADFCWWLSQERQDLVCEIRECKNEM